MYAPDPQQLQRLNRSHPLNKAALVQLRKAGQDPGEQQNLFILELAQWGMEENVHVPGMKEDQGYVLKTQVDQMSGIDPETVLEWLVNHPEIGDSPEEQEEELLAAIEGAETPERAAGRLLEEMQSNLATQIPALRM